MATTELTSRASLSWLNEWWEPFLWITVIPVITVPISAILFSALAGYHEGPDVGLPADRAPGWFGTLQYSEAVPTAIVFTLPGLLNLVPLMWIFSNQSRARIAGLTAGLLGALRLAIPALVLTFGYERVTNPDGVPYFKFVTGFGLSDPYVGVWFFGALAWLVTLLVWAVFGRISRGKEGV